ncbi:MAG: amino acid permease, partial [Actinomycetota bacterium]|nr:amino acid permease [Actinomycetota bacterium]
MDGCTCSEPSRSNASGTTPLETWPPRGHLRKRLSARYLVGFGIGVVIGTGIFTLTDVAARETAGPAVVVSFAVAGVVALLAALCYAELASSAPTPGSAYSYATAGEVVAWVIGWDLFLEFALGAAVVARGWSGYVGSLLDLPPSLFDEEAPVNVGAAFIVVALTAVAVLGIRESARVTALLVVVKVTVCVFVIVAGAWFVRGANLTPFVPGGRPAEGEGGPAQPLIQAVAGIEPVAFGIGGVLTAAAVVFSSYTGFEAVANLSEETRRPGRDLPLGLFGTLGIATVLYVGVSLVVVGMIPYDRIDPGAPIADAFDQVGLGWAAALISLAAVAGLTSVILVDLITIGRIGFDGPGRAAAPVDRPGQPAHRDVGAGHPGLRRPRLRHGDLRAAGRPSRPGQHRHAVRVPARLGGRHRAAVHPAGDAQAVPGPVLPGGAAALRRGLRLPDAQPEHRDVGCGFSPGWRWACCSTRSTATGTRGC